MTNRKIEYWVIPPKADAEFVAGMEEVLETYEKPYDPRCPVVCMDEQPVQLLKETRTPIPATAQHGKRVDYEYERAGTANIFMFTEPLAGWREVAVRETKTKIDWAVEVARLLEGRYAECEKVILVCDNLNTHTKGAFYEAFEAERARQLVRRIDFRHTPKHELAEHCGERTQLAHPPMRCWQAIRQRPNVANRNRCLVDRRELDATRR
jgi:hypothetical protein